MGGTALERVGVNGLSRLQMLMLSRHKPVEVLELLRRVRRERTTLQTGYETFIIYSMARAYCRLPGEMAEVGVFQGASAKLICTVKGSKPLHLFDTFEGLPKASAQDGDVHKPAQYACSLESVQAYLKGFENVHFYKGLFPASAAELHETKFCFVHLDVDLYDSTMAALHYFYPRMTTGGLIISHDYSLLAGVKTAVDEFMRDKPEPVVELPTTQCMLNKLPSG